MEKKKEKGHLKASKPPEEQKIYHHKEPTFNFGKLFLGIILLVLGMAYFMKVIGLANIDININLWQLWPLFVIFIGLSMLSRKDIFSNITGITVTLMVLGIFFLTIFGYLKFTDNRVAAYKNDISVLKEANVDSAVLRVETGAGNLKIKGGSPSLISGNAESDFVQVVPASSVEGTTQNILLSSENKEKKWMFLTGRVNKLDVTVDSQTPFKFYINTGAVDINLDFSNIITDYTEIKTGASKLFFTLGDKVETSNVKIEAGASSINIVLPQTVGTKIKIYSSLSSKDFSGFKKIDENTYQSSNYESSTKKINIECNLGVSSLNVSWK